MPTFVRVASYEGALAAPDADVAVFSPAGELGRAALEGLGDELVGLACSARPFAVRVVAGPADQHADRGRGHGAGGALDRFGFGFGFGSAC